MRTLPILALSVVLASTAHAEQTGWHLRVGVVCQAPGSIREAAHRMRSDDIEGLHRLGCYLVGKGVPVIPMATGYGEQRVMAHLSAGWSPVWTLPAFLEQDAQP